MGEHPVELRTECRPGAGGGPLSRENQFLHLVTYLGGNNVDQGNGIAVDAAGSAYVAGYTASSDFPLQSPLRSSNANSVDAFVTKINPAGSALVYSTYLGGSATDYGTAIAVDASGNAYVTRVVSSEDFPVVNAIDSTLGSHAVDDAFVAKINPSGSARLFSTFVGGTGSESGRGIAVDWVGNIHIAGESTSTDFPIVKALQGANGGGAVSQDGFVLLMDDAAPFKGPTITTVSDNLIAGGAVVPGGWFYIGGSDFSDVARVWGVGDFTDSTTCGEEPGEPGCIPLEVCDAIIADSRGSELR